MAANWKMHKTAAETKEFFNSFLPGAAGEKNADIVIFPSFLSLPEAGKAVEGSEVAVGAQNMYFETSGAFTGEVSAEMIAETGAGYVLIGHSERRHIFGENGELLGVKVAKALDSGLVPVYCVGETLEERESGEAWAVVARHLAEAPALADPEQAPRVIVAYEPVWAIGTGKTATAADAQKMCAFIRAELTEKTNAATAERVRILYGGSVKPENTAEIMAEKDINGVLVGGAGLKPDSFLEIIRKGAEADGSL